ncbi:MAG: pyrroline-5-carboxylate reductase, partial [Clostridia bacterium]|nr:pyrroline-5-carboxylate reductase [Clostridia bacterium]
AASAVSGCGPAYAYMFIEALADGAVKCGLPRNKALLYAKQTLLGAAALALASDAHPEALKDAVCSPGGTTIEGVLALENGAFRHDVASAVIAAYEKTLKLGK